MNSVSHAIADVQGGPDGRRLAIDKVGIKDLRHPVAVRDRDGRAQHTVGRFSVFVHLPHDRRGTHMSRFIEILNGHREPLAVATVAGLLARIAATLHSDAVYLEVNFPYFVTKHAPVSGVASLMDYDVTLTAARRDQETEVTLKVVVPITSLCPCSKQISDYGAHNQRSHVTLTVRADPRLWLEDLIELVEEEASCEIYGLIKRADEKFVTERAYDNPKFVEDLVRDVAARLHAEPRVLAYTVESENFESIHNHSAYALIQHDK
jgi:GTP cyclohydrolase I